MSKTRPSVRGSSEPEARPDNRLLAVFTSLSLNFFQRLLPTPARRWKIPLKISTNIPSIPASLVPQTQKAESLPIRRAYCSITATRSFRCRFPGRRTKTNNMHGAWKSKTCTKNIQKFGSSKGRSTGWRGRAIGGARSKPGVEANDSRHACAWGDH